MSVEHIGTSDMIIGAVDLRAGAPSALRFLNRGRFKEKVIRRLIRFRVE